MTRYMSVKVNVSKGQIQKIKRAVQTGSQVSIQLAHKDLSGDHVLALTQAQINQIAKAYEKGTGVILKMSKTQLEHNAKIEGGFLSLILPALATAGRFLVSNVLPKLATGALAGIGAAAGSKAVDKVVGSNVLYVKRDGMGAKITRTAGKGLHLAPWPKGSSVDDGVYVKSGDGYGYVDGRGLLLGPDSPFKNIPILGMIL